MHNIDKDNYLLCVENPTVVIPMENRGAAGAGGIDTDGHRQSSPSQENPQDAVRLTSHSYVLPCVL